MGEGPAKWLRALSCLLHAVTPKSGTLWQAVPFHDEPAPDCPFVLCPARFRSESGFYRQCGVENAIYRYKTIIGKRLRAREDGAREGGVILGGNILNLYLDLGRPVSVCVG